MKNVLFLFCLFFPIVTVAGKQKKSSVRRKKKRKSLVKEQARKQQVQPSKAKKIGRKDEAFALVYAATAVARTLKRGFVKGGTIEAAVKHLKGGQTFDYYGRQVASVKNLDEFDSGVRKRANDILSGKLEKN